MNFLNKLGLTNNELKDIIEICPEISVLSHEEILSIIELLKKINLTDLEIKDILLANPFFLNRSYLDIYKLIIKLSIIGINNINSVITINPFLLNKEPYEIDEYFSNGIKKGYTIQNLIKILEENPYIIEEI